MIGRRSLGPVFAYDMLSQARRWQVYASRAVFVLLLFVGVLIAWSSSNFKTGPNANLSTHRQMAKIGENFFYALAGVQLGFILLAAPAATAGSICIDRSRGTLLHMMVTDLSDVEIVLGRLGSRLAPMFGLVACALPVVAISGLLGGIDFGALLGLFVISVALTILGCSLALAISVRATKTHEVLMAVYFAFGAWLLSLPIYGGMAAGSKWFRPPPDWFTKTNPFVLVYSSYMQPGLVEPIDFAIFFAGALSIAVALVGWSILRLRRAVVELSGQSERPIRPPGWIARHWPSLPGPTLDGNPVLWREWHRNRPSRMARWLSRGLFVVTWVLVACGTYTSIRDGVPQYGSVIFLGFGLQLFFGLLMVAATSSTVMAEERTRGSLDILLSTPLSTRSIVLAKWWGAYRMVLGLAIMPIFVGIFLATACPDAPPTPAFKGAMPSRPLTPNDRFSAAACCIADFLVSGALIVSIGVLLATWISRIGRAVGASVVIYLVLGIGLPIALEFLFINYYNRMVNPAWGRQFQWIMQAIQSISPAVGSLPAIETLPNYSYEPRDFLWVCLQVVIIGKLVIAGFVFCLTLWTFNRCLGRVVESRPNDYRPPTGPPALRIRKPAPARTFDRPLADVIDSQSPRP